nr:reverse transcriptase domain-containing protein [Tanacetum cinerariifolium]
MTDNRTMTEMLRAPTEGCAKAIVVPSIIAEQFELKHSLINMMTSEQFFGLEKDNLHDHIRWGSPHLDTFYNALNPTDQDSLNAAAGGNLLEKSPQYALTIIENKSKGQPAGGLKKNPRVQSPLRWQFIRKSPQDALTIIENKSKVRNSQSKPIASPVNACDNHSSYVLAKLAHAVNQQTSVVTTAMTAMLKQFQSNPPPAQVKAVEEIYVTCGGAHLYYQCLAAGGNTFPEYRDNIQGYISTAVGNYNQGNPGYRPQGVANQMRPPGVDNTKTRRPQPRSNTKHDRVPFASKSSQSKNKEAELEEHHRNLLLSKNNKHISSACNNIQINSQDVISKVVCAMCKKCLIFVNHDKCLHNYVNGKNSSGKKQNAKVSVKEIQMKYQPKVAKPKK